MCNEYPLVSAIIPTYKRKPEMVKRALSSAVGQTYPNMEVIVVDDSPLDYELREAVRALVESFGATYIDQKGSKGACTARNTGLAVARGEFVAFLDDDDEWVPEKIAKQIVKFEREEIALIYTEADIVNDSTGDKRRFEVEHLSGHIFDKLLEGNYIGATSTPLIRAQYLREVGGFDEQMQSAQDYDLWLRLAQKYRIDYCKEPLMIYHIHDGDRITTNYRKKIAGLEQIIEKYRPYLKKKRKVMGMKQIMLTPFYSGDGQLWKALRCWCAGVCKDPVPVKRNLKYLKWIFRNYSAYKKNSH